MNELHLLLSNVMILLFFALIDPNIDNTFEWMTNNSDTWFIIFCVSTAFDILEISSIRCRHINKSYSADPCQHMQLSIFWCWPIIGECAFPMSATLFLLQGFICSCSISSQSYQSSRTFTKWFYMQSRVPLIKSYVCLVPPSRLMQFPVKCNYVLVLFGN